MTISIFNCRVLFQLDLLLLQAHSLLCRLSVEPFLFLFAFHLLLNRLAFSGHQVALFKGKVSTAHQQIQCRCLK